MTLQQILFKSKDPLLPLSATVEETAAEFIIRYRGRTAFFPRRRPDKNFVRAGLLILKGFNVT